MFEWDEPKRQWNLRERHIDFADSLPVFSSPEALAVEDRRKNYGEKRFNLLCPLNEMLFMLHLPDAAKLFALLPRAARTEGKAKRVPTDYLTRQGLRP